MEDSIKVWESATNAELENECDNLDREYREQQKIMREIYDKMSELSEKYINLKKILDRRHGKK